MQTHIDSYKRQGFVPVAINGSGIGAEVFIHPNLNKVVKFGQDPAYDVFVRYALSAPCPEFPCFFHHDTPAGPFRINSNDPYTVTEMEPLHPLTGAECHALIAWFDGLIEALRRGTDPYAVHDPYQLTRRLLNLQQVAVQQGVCLDMQKPSNYMARVTAGQRKIVITDPFNGSC